MRVTVRKWGNRAVVDIPPEVLEAAQVKLDEEVEICEEGGRIVIVRTPPPRYDLTELLSAITPENLHQEVDFGGPQGREVF